MPFTFISPTAQFSGTDDQMWNTSNMSMTTDNIYGDERNHRQISDSLNLSISQVIFRISKFFEEIGVNLKFLYRFHRQ